jgi:hypothetical protein
MKRGIVTILLTVGLEIDLRGVVVAGTVWLDT